MATPRKSAFIGARVSGKLKRRVKVAAKATSQQETDFIEVALLEFFDRHPTAAAQFEAIKARRMRELSAA